MHSRVDATITINESENNELFWFHMDKSCFPNLILPCSGRKFKRSSIDGATWKECYWSKWWRWCDHDAAGPTGRLCLVVFHPLFSPFINSAATGTLRVTDRIPKQRNYGRPWQVLSYQRSQMSVGTMLRVLTAPKNFCRRPSSTDSISSPVHRQTNALQCGPPGTGKSYLANQSCCDRGKEHIFQSVILSASGGEIPRGLFQLTRESKPAIIFIDDIDLLASSNPNLKDHGG